MCLENDLLSDSSVIELLLMLPLGVRWRDWECFPLRYFKWHLSGLFLLFSFNFFSSVVASHTLTALRLHLIT